MKIALCVPSWPPGFAANGIVTYASYLVPALRALGHEVFILTHQNMAQYDDPYTIDLRRFVSDAALWRRVISRTAPNFSFHKNATSNITRAINNLLSKHEVDVLEMEESFGWSFELTRLNLLPVVVRLHGPWLLTGPFNRPGSSVGSDARRQAREGRAIQYADYVTAPSAAVMASVKKHYGIDISGCVIPNPIGSCDTSELWSLSTCNPNMFLFVGRFDELKGGDIVLRAFAEVALRHSEATFVFVGPDGAIKPPNSPAISYEQFVRTNLPEGVAQRIKFYGAMSHSDVMSLRTKTFVTISASRYESSPYAVLEAMSLGCPIIATAVGGVPEIIQNQRNGLLVSSEGVGEMAAACQSLLFDRKLSARLGRQAWMDCQNSFNPMLIAKKTIAAYERAVAAFKSRPRARPRR